MKNLKLTLALTAIGFMAQAQPYTGMTTYNNNTNPSFFNSGNITSVHTNGFALAGYRPSASAGTSNIFFDKTDDQAGFTGTGTFQKAYQLSAGNTVCSSTPVQQLISQGASVIETNIASNVHWYAMATSFNTGCVFALLNSGGNVNLSNFYRYPATATSPTKPFVIESTVNPGTYFVCGSYLDGGNTRKIYILRISNSATLIWSRIYDVGQQRSFTPTAIIEAFTSTSPELIIVGHANLNLTFGIEAFFMRIDGAGGAVIQFRLYGSTTGSSVTDQFHSIALAKQGTSSPFGYIVGGYTNASSNGQAWMTLLSPGGVIMWTSSIEPTNSSVAGPVVGVTSRFSNTYGAPEFYGAINTSVGTIVAKLDNTGNAFSMSDNEFYYEPGTNSVPGAITNIDAGTAGNNTGIHVYGNTLNNAAGSDYYLVQACFNGALANCTTQTLTTLALINPGPTMNTYIPPVNIAAGLTNCTNHTFTSFNNGFTPSVLCYTTTLPTTPYPGSNARIAVTGIGELSAGGESNNIRFQPNPVTDKLSIIYTSAKNEDVTVEIYNSVGQLVKSLLKSAEAGENTAVIDLNALNISTGIYFVKTIINGTVNQQKIVYTK